MRRDSEQLTPLELPAVGAGQLRAEDLQGLKWMDLLSKIISQIRLYYTNKVTGDCDNRRNKSRGDR